jgi:hypothetical protein
MLATHFHRLERRLSKFENIFIDRQQSYMNCKTLDRFNELEGLVSVTWQAWSAFCRGVVIDSCLGTTTASGLVTLPKIEWVSWRRVTYEATCFAKSTVPKVTKATTSIRQEMTWGDQDRLLRAINGLRPTNFAQLLPGFGLGVVGPKHLQKVRNATAHMNNESMLEIKALSATYFGPRLRHPLDISWWQHAATRETAYLSWIDDLRDIARVAIS